jgi:hypothetical protein
MMETQNIECEAQILLHPILPQVEEILEPQIRKVRLVWEQFSSRLHRKFPALLLLPLQAAQRQHSSKYHYHEK